MKNFTAYQRLIQFTDSLIRANKKVTPDGYQLHVDSLYDSDREEFAAHLIENDSFQKEGWDWLLEDAYREEIASTFTASILAWRKGEREEMQAAFLESLKQSAVKVYANRMQMLINDRIGTVEAEDSYEAKYPTDNYYEGHAA